MFSQGKTIPIPINNNRDEAATQYKIDVKRVAASSLDHRTAGFKLGDGRERLQAG